MKNFFKISQVTWTILLFLVIGAFEVVKTEAAEQNVRLKSVVTIGGSQKQIANSITVDDNGNSIVAGVFNSGVDFDPGPTSTIFNPTGTQDGFIAKYSSSEELVWAKQIRTATSNSSINVRKHAVDFEGNIVIIGEFKGTVDFDPGFSATEMTANVDLAGFYAKYSSTGELIFARKFDTTHTTVGTCNVYDLFIDPVGRIYMTGSTTGSIDLDAGPAALTKIPRVWDDLWFELVDKNGAIITATILSGTNSSKGKTITVDENQNVYIGVEFTGIFDADPTNNATLLTSLIGEDAALLKFSSSTNLEYAKQFESSTGNVSLTDMVAVKNSNNVTSIFVSGNFTSAMDLDPNSGSAIRISQGSTDIFVGKYLASDGSYEQGFSIGGTGSDISSSLAIDSWQNSILLGGNFSSLVDFDPSNGATMIPSKGNLDNFFASYSSANLSFNFVKTTGGAGDEKLTSLFYNQTLKKIGSAGSFQDSSDFNPDQATTRIVRTSQGIDNFWLSGFDHYITATVENDTIWGVRPFSFGVSANVINDGNNPITERGFVYSRSADSLTVTLGTKVVVGSGTGLFGTNITNLKDSTLYYYRAFAKNDLGYVYTETKSVSTLHPFDVPATLTTVIPDTNKVSVRLNWSLQTNAIRSNKFYVVRKDFGINGDNTEAQFEVLAVVPRDTTVENYVFTDNGVNPHRKYTYDVVPTALVIIGEQPKDPKTGPPTTSDLTRVVPTATDVVTTTEVRDSVRNIHFNWVITPKDSTTSKIYIEYGSGSNPSTFVVIDSIARTLNSNGGTYKISKINDQRIQHGIHTIRLRPASSIAEFPAGTSSTISFNADTLKYNSAPILSTCKDSVYSYTPSLKKTTLGSVMHSIVNPPSGVSFNQMNGAINWTPQSNGIYNFQTIVTSSYNTAIRDTQQYSVTVTTCLPPQWYNVKCVSVTGGIITANNHNVTNAKITAHRIDQQINTDMIMTYEAAIVNNAYSLHLPAGNYKLQFSGVNYQSKWYYNGTSIQDAETVTTECNQNQVIDFNNIANPSSTTTMNFGGRVTNSAGANLVASVRFIPVNSAGQKIGDVTEVVSTTNGTYNSTIDATQKYLVFCSAVDYNSQYFDKASSIVQATTVDINTQNKSAINFVLTPEVPTQYVMNGIVENSSGQRVEAIIIAHRIKNESGQIIPIPEITSTETIVSSILGTWTLKNVKQGTYVILAIPKTKEYIPGYANFQAVSAPRSWIDATEIPITTQLTTQIPTIRLEATDGTKGIHKWTGNVYSEAAGLKFGRKQREQPSSTITEPGVIIMLNDNNGKVSDYAISSNNGFVELDNLELGFFEYEASKVGFLASNGQIEVVENSDTTGQIIIQRHPLYSTNASVIEMSSNSFVYPNPVATNFQIHLTGAEGDAEVTIMDYLGRIRLVQNFVLTGDVFDATLSAKDLEQGTYKILVRSGRKTAVSSLVIRR
ncbi:MAG: T9SS type A sorting domain-containing protein [Candidatus Kapabacteria bacterium]|nr:T9SS type A sorting domain-containing protein [Candidatus Kapabacteria bacterium]